MSASVFSAAAVSAVPSFFFSEDSAGVSSRKEKAVPSRSMIFSSSSSFSGSIALKSSGSMIRSSSVAGVSEMRLSSAITWPSLKNVSLTRESSGAVKSGISGASGSVSFLSTLSTAATPASASSARVFGPSAKLAGSLRSAMERETSATWIVLLAPVSGSFTAA